MIRWIRREWFLLGYNYWLIQSGFSLNEVAELVYYGRMQLKEEED